MKTENLSDSEKRELERLRKLLEEESSKPDSEVDFDKIDKITLSIMKICKVELTPEQEKKNIEKIYEKINEYEERRSKIRKVCTYISSAVACAAVVFALNCYTVSSFGENIISTAIKMTENGFSLDFSQSYLSQGTQTSDTNTTVISTVYTTSADISAAEDTVYTTSFRQDEGVIFTTIPEFQDTGAIMEISTSPPQNTSCADVVTAVEDVDTFTTEAEMVNTTAVVEECATTTAPSGTGAFETSSVEMTIPADTTVLPTTTDYYVEESPVPVTTFPAEDVPETTTVTTVPETSILDIEINRKIRLCCKIFGVEPMLFSEEIGPFNSAFDFKYDLTDISTDLYFVFRRFGDDVRHPDTLNLTIEKYNSVEEIPEILIPSESFQTETISVPYGTIYVFIDDTQTTAVMVRDDIMYTLVGRGIGSEELKHIACSLVENPEK